MATGESIAEMKEATVIGPAWAKVKA